MTLCSLKENTIPRKQQQALTQENIDSKLESLNNIDEWGKSIPFCVIRYKMVRWLKHPIFGRDDVLDEYIDNLNTFIDEKNPIHLEINDWVNLLSVLPLDVPDAREIFQKVVQFVMTSYERGFFQALHIVNRIPRYRYYRALKIYTEVSNEVMMMNNTPYPIVKTVVLRIKIMFPRAPLRIYEPLIRVIQYKSDGISIFERRLAQMFTPDEIVNIYKMMVN